MTTAPVLILPNPNEYFVVYCDASKMVLGGVLMQNGQVVAYASRQLKVHESSSCGVCVKDLETLSFWL